MKGEANKTAKERRHDWSKNPWALVAQGSAAQSKRSNRSIEFGVCHQFDIEFLQLHQHLRIGQRRQLTFALDVII